MANFEQKKNVKALGITIIVCGCILTMLLLISWQVPKILPPETTEGIEVNLGTSDEGMGEIPVMAVGEPGVQENTNANERNIENIPEQAETKEEIGEPINDNEASTVKEKKATIVKKGTDKIIIEPTKPIIAPKPKAILKNGNSKDVPNGNHQDSYNGINNQGIAGGKGDQGKINGNINSDSYTGNGGNGSGGAVRIKSGLVGRKFTKYPTFEDEFNENAKVAVDIIVNAEGKITSALVNPKGTTTTNLAIKNIALKKALLLKMNSSEATEQVGTIVFEFKLKS